MPVVKDKAGINPSQEDVEVEQKMQTRVVNDEKKENNQGMQEMEDKYEEVTKVPVDNQQEVRHNEVEDRNEDGEEKVKYFEVEQGSSESDEAEDMEEKFKETEEEIVVDDEHSLAREQDACEKINHITAEDIQVNEKLPEEENQALEGGKCQEENCKPHMQGTSGSVDGHSVRVLPIPHQLSLEDLFEKMHEASENKAQETMVSGEEKELQLEERKGLSEAAKKHDETSLAALAGSDIIAESECIAEMPLSHLSNSPETPVPSGQFPYTEGVEAEIMVTDMNKEGKMSGRPIAIAETAINEESDVQGGNNVVTKSGKKHLESLDLRENENAKEGNSEGKECDTGKLLDLREKFQDECQQEDNEFVKLPDKGKEIRDIVQRTQILDSRSTKQEIKDASKAAAAEEVQFKDNEENTGLHDKADKAQCPYEMPVQIATIVEPSLLMNDEKQVVVEAIPVEIEEKVIPDEEGKQNNLSHRQEAYTTEIHGAFNNTDGREKKPVPDAVLAVESNRDKTIELPNDNSKSILAEKYQSDVELAENDSEEDEETNDTMSSLTAKIAATAGSSGTSSSSSGLSLPARPAGLGSSVPLLEPVSRAVQHSRANSSSASRASQVVEDQTSGESDENNETREKLQMIRVKFLRLAHRLGQTPHNVVVAQVLYRLGLAEQLRGSRNSNRAGAFSFDRASAIAEQQEAAGQEALDFSCTVMVLGKTGVGKSSTINSIFDEVKSGTDAFRLGTKKVQEIVGTVQGIKIRVIDTPGLLASSADQHHNEKVLQSVKHFIKKTPPDIVLYFDRLDMQSRDYGDLPLLHTITEIFAPAVWFNAIVVLTHAASAPPDGPNGTPLSYEMFVAQRSHVVQQAIRQAAGDMRLMNPVSLVENHSACRTNRAGQRVLPNGQIWKPQLLLLCFASKILAEANALLKLQDSPTGKAFGMRPRVPPLPYLLSSLLQSRAQLKMPEEQLGDEDVSEEELEEASDAEDESEYDRLPNFRPLTKSELNKLSKEQKEAYYKEVEHREKLFMKKQLKEERMRRRLMRKRKAASKEQIGNAPDMEEENGGSESVPVPMPDMALPPSFDADNPTHRYRYLDSDLSNQWLVRPVLETHGWDHDIGYEGVNVEKMFVVDSKIPVSVSGQATKDKRESSLQMECATSLNLGEGKSTLAGLEIQSVGKELSYTLRSETRFNNFKHNKTTAGLAITLLGNAIAAGMKLEDILMIGKRFKLVLNGGAITGRGDVAYGGSVEATLRDKDYTIGRSLSTLGLSIMDWHGDLAIGCNLQSQFPVGRNTTITARANLNNRGAGQISIRTSSSEQLQLVLIGFLPILRTLQNRWAGSS